MLQLRIKSFLNDKIDWNAAVQFNVSHGGVKMHVAQHVLTFFANKMREQHLFCSPALVSWNHIIVIKDILDRIFDPEKRAAPCIGLITHHHGGPLVITHGPCSAVR